MSNTTGKYDFGMIGLGTMGRNLLLNMGDHGVAGAGYDKDASKGKLLEEEDKNGNLKGFSDVKDFVASLKSPKAIMMLVPAGKIVDSVIEDLLPLLDKGDILIDGGNSHFTDTDRRVAYLETKGFHFFGMGVSGGEEGARRGPSMMPGGDKEAYNVMKPILEAIAAKVDGVPCVTYIGPGASGHFVKMVHNGIEYGLMQLIAETYEVMKKGLQMDDEAIGKIFTQWNEGRLQSFLMEITSDIFEYKEQGSDQLLLDNIKDEARAKGTGKWTSQVAMDEIYSTNDAPLSVDKNSFLIELEQAFYFTMIMSYAQGMHLLSKASAEYKYGLHLAEIAKIWRGGCIIRSGFLNEIFTAYEKDNNLPHLLLDEGVQKLTIENVPGIRSVLSKAITAGIAMPAYAASLSYFDNLRNKQMPSNLIQAQRDYFGAHTYELIGKEGVFHTKWGEKSISIKGSGVKEKQ
jgi:6-phosphogluconate dehydrogenase